MSIVILKELEVYTVDPTIDENNLVKKFKLENDLKKFSEVINELNNTTFLIHRKPIFRVSDLSTNYLQQNDQEDELSEVPLNLANVETFQFTFVGIIFILGITIMIYPKHIENINDDVNQGYKKFKQIMKVISKYHKRQEQNIFLTLGESVHVQNKLSISVQLLDYFSENGLYSIQDDIFVKDGDGFINWEKTVNETPVVVSGGSPIYLTPFTETTTVDEQHIVRLIQIAVLNDIRENFSSIFTLLDYCIPEDFQLLLSDLDELDILLYHLEKERYSQFVSHKIQLITLLKLYLTNNIMDTNINSIEFWGVTKFAPVWEDVCKKVYKDHLNNTIGNLGLAPVGNLTSESKLKDVIEHPIWLDVKKNNYYKAPKSLELDVLHVDSKNKNFNIYDAKYYLIQFEGNSLRNVPGIGDITKQYLYQQAYVQLSQKNNYSFKNHFIVPSDNLLEDKGKGVIIAEVTLPLFAEFDLSKIQVIARDCEMFFNKYLFDDFHY